MLLQIIGAYFVTVAFSIMFNNTLKQSLFGGLAGAIGWTAYLLILNSNGSIVLASFLGAFGASIIAYILSILRKAPVTVFQIPGIIPIVPGTGMYRAMYAAVSKDNELMISYLLETLQIAGAIAIGMMLVYTIRLVTDRVKP